MSRLFENCPYALQRVAVILASSSPIGPPKGLASLLILNRAAHRALTSNAFETYLSIFAHTFDIAAPLSRLGRSVVKQNIFDELRRRFTLLKVFRRREFSSPLLTEALWLAYLMFEDSDKSQRNFRQLLWAGLPQFLDVFVRDRLYDVAEDNHGWPLPNEKNSLAVALFWMASTHSSVGREQVNVREEALSRLAPFVFAAFRYPIFNHTEIHLNLSDYVYKPTSDSQHGPYPPPPFEHDALQYFGDVTRTARVPLLSVFATLSFFVRKEIVPPTIPPHLLASRRRTREEANARGEAGPTVEDVDYFVKECQTRFADVPIVDVRSYSISGSLGFQPLYKLGSLTGAWQGSYMIPYLGDYEKWLADIDAPEDLSTTGRLPLFMTLQEHYTCDSSQMVPSASAEEGTTNAWLPSKCSLKNVEGGIEVTDEEGTFKHFYHTFHHGANSAPAPHEVADVIITGKTDAHHAAAWGAYKILGRVRMSDGLIALARDMADDMSMRMLLRGYVTSSHNFVGRMKGASSGSHPAGWEAVFSLCKRPFEKKSNLSG